MEEAQGTYNQEDYIKWMYLHLGIEGTNSNGHGEGRDENMNMVETIKNLQKDVQSHKYDNERLMRGKDKQEDFNMDLMQSLNKIENKLDKKSGLRKSGSHRSPDVKRRAISVSIHHHQSPSHSNKRAHKNLSPSPVRKHKRFGVDELQGQINKIKPPTFDGEYKKDEDAETWLLGMIKYFQLHNYSSHEEGRIVIYKLKGKASMWWDHLVQVQHIKEKSVT
jgi:hypothetical protein